ncbi:MAG: signal peptidase I [Actinobacteria bacterium]|nr:MAG: signal peptidase I [Actinomycetota bacterium]
MRGPLERFFPNLSRRTRTVIDWVLTLAIAVGVVLAVKAWVVNPYRIPSSSMEPTLHCARPGMGCEARSSDRILANRFIYHFRDPKRGEIVVFNPPAQARVLCPGGGGVYVKRIIGIPGDRWKERSGYVYIDGKRLNEPYVEAARRDDQTKNLSDLLPGATRIPKDDYLMMGDNRSESCDSRTWGLVPRKNIVGEVFLTYWPVGRIATH